MIFSISKRLLHPPVASYTSLFGSRSYGVRRNASHNFFSTVASETITFSDPTSLSMKSLLKSYGFTEADISQVMARCSHVFKLNAENNVLPKLKFFTSIGVPKEDLPKLVTGNNYLLSSSLQNQKIPNFNFLLNSVALTNDQLARALRLHPALVVKKLDTVLAPNISLLKEIGLSPPELTSMVVQRPPALCRNHELFKSCIDKVVSMGVKPSMKKFTSALLVLCGMSEAKLEEKMTLYRSYGMSEDEILVGFQKQPSMMGISKVNISKSMEFFIEELKWTPSDIARAPVVLVLNLERVERRSRVLEKLVEKGLRREVTLRSSSFLKLGEEKFFDGYVKRYAADLPEILDIYNGVGSK